MRLLTAHAGRLYAGNGYWEDRPGPEGRQGAQILVLDRPSMPWQVDHAFEERLPNGRWRDLAVGALAEANFATDSSGTPLPRPEPRPEASRGASLPRHAIVEGARNTIAPSGSSEA
jgi:hypothetical protein